MTEQLSHLLDNSLLKGFLLSHGLGQTKFKLLLLSTA
jgi:hypothetical protein